MNSCISSIRPLSLWVVALLLCAAPADAAPVSWDPAQVETLNAWAWEAHQVFELPGARLRIRRFRTPIAPVDAAQQLTRAGASRFDRVQFSGAVLSLSGVQGGLHWLAQLRPSDDGGQGTVGLLSSLGPDDRYQTGFDPAELVPFGARLVLRTASGLSGTGRLSSYLCPGSSPRVATTVRRALSDRGWRPLGPDPAVSGGEQGRADLLAREWGHPSGDNLTIHVYSRGGDVALTFWHRPKENP